MRKKLLTAFIALLFIFPLFANVSLAQPAEELKALRKDIESLKQGQKSIQKELEEIKNLLRGRVAAQPSQPQEVLLTVKDDPFKGEKGAKLTLIEFSDFQCPFCAGYFRETLPQIEREYLKTGKVRYVFRHFPIESIHPQAFKAAQAATCAGEQGKFWEMHDRLFANQNAIGAEDLPNHAQALGLDLPAFRNCLDSGKYASKIRQDIAEAERVGVKGTPTFFIGFTESNDSQMKALRVIRGAQPFGIFKTTIESLLSAQK